jgi:HAD superfamily hydrolase (TIGR01509 family)
MNQPRSRGVLFDIDGTLLDTNYLHVVAWWRAFRDTGHDEVDMASIHHSIGQSSPQLVHRLVGRDDDATVEAHSRQFAELQPEAEALPGAGELLQELAASGRRVVLATSAKESDLEWMLPLIGAADAVHGVSSSADVDESKPSPEILELSMREHGLDPDRTIMVGDTVWDIAAAKNAGLPCIALTCGGISEVELRQAGASEVYADPADLLANLGRSLLRSAGGALTG